MVTEKTVFLLQNNHYDRIGRLIGPCLEFCGKYGIGFIDRSLTSDFDPDFCDVDWGQYDSVVVFGSIGWTKRISQSSLAPFVFYDRKRFATDYWIPFLGAKALNGGGRAMLVQELEDELKAGGKFHLRPNHDDKAFAGAVHDFTSWNDMVESRAREGLRLPEPDLECWVSPIRMIQAEYRCWFVDGKLIEVSSYRKDGKPYRERNTDEVVWEQAKALAELYLPLKTCVMDIADTADGYCVIEYNPLNASGWYDADVDNVLSAWITMLQKNAL